METRQQNDRKHKISGFVYGYFISGFPRLSPKDPIASRFPVVTPPSFPTSRLPVPSSAFLQNGGRGRKLRCCGCRFLHDRPCEVGLVTSLAPSCILTQNCLILTVFVFHLQLRSTATQSGRNCSWRQVLDGLRWQRCKSVRHGSSTRS